MFHGNYIKTIQLHVPLYFINTIVSNARMIEIQDVFLPGMV